MEQSLKTLSDHMRSFPKNKNLSDLGANGPMYPSFLPLPFFFFKDGFLKSNSDPVSASKASTVSTEM